MGGAQRSDDVEADRKHIWAMAEAGATWWVEYTGVQRPLEEIRAAVEAGPIRIEE
jgi:hypothetical protein